MLKNLPTMEEIKPRFDPWVGKIPWKRKWQSTPVFLTGESHEQKSLVGYSSWGCKELELLTRTCTHTHTHTHGLNCSAACGIFLDQGLNPCLLYQQADSLPLRNQGSPRLSSLTKYFPSFLGHGTLCSCNAYLRLTSNAQSYLSQLSP